MDELSSFERRLEAGLEAYAGPRRAVEPVSIARAAAARGEIKRSLIERVTTMVKSVDGTRARSRVPPAYPILVAIAAVALLVVGGFAVASLINDHKAPQVVPSLPSNTASPSASPSVEPTPSISPSQAEALPFVVYMRRGSVRFSYNLWAARIDGSGVSHVSSGGGDVAWSQDGRRLLVVRGEHGSQHLYIADVSDEVGPLVDTGLDTGSAKGCTGWGGAPWACQDGWFSLAPDGQHLAFVRACTWELPGCYSVATMDLRSGTVSVLSATTKSGRYPIEGVQWSPDGSTIAFSRFRDLQARTNGKFLPVQDIYTIDADGRNLRRLNLGGLSGSAPAWSKDGSTIAFATDIWRTESVHESDVYTIRADGTNLRRLTTDGASGQPSWTVDDRLLFWRGDSFWTMDADGGAVAELPSFRIPAHAVVQTGWPTSGLAVQPIR